MFERKKKIIWKINKIYEVGHNFLKLEFGLHYIADIFEYMTIPPEFSDHLDLNFQTNEP